MTPLDSIPSTSEIENVNNDLNQREERELSCKVKCTGQKKDGVASRPERLFPLCERESEEGVQE